MNPRFRSIPLAFALLLALTPTAASAVGALRQTPTSSTGATVRSSPFTHLKGSTHSPSYPLKHIPIEDRGRRRATPPPQQISLNSPCQNVVFVGARGSGESASKDKGLGMGWPVYNAFNYYKSKLSPTTSFGYWPVMPYPAVSANKIRLYHYRASVFYPSIDTGVNSLRSFLMQRSDLCHQEHYVLSGYSQGGMVVHRAFMNIWASAQLGNRYARAIIRRIDGVIMVADGDRVDDQGGSYYGTAPARESWGVIWSIVWDDTGGAQFTPANAKIPDEGAFSSARWRDVCQMHDTVCDFPHVYRLGMEIHGSAYAKKGQVKYSKFRGQSLPALRAAAEATAKVTNTWTPWGIPSISTNSLPSTYVGQPYSSTLSTTDGRDGEWSITSGDLPPGLALVGPTIEGTPPNGSAGLAQFEVTFTDSYGQSDTRGLSILVEYPDEHPIGWLSVSTGAAHTCGLKPDYSLWCWGLNASGQLGDGTFEDHAAPAQIAGTWSSIETHGTASHTCGIREGTQLWCWGENSSGQLADTTTTKPRHAHSSTWQLACRERGHRAHLWHTK